MKTKITCLFFLILIGVSISLEAQSVVTIGTGTSTSNSTSISPQGTFFEDVRKEFLYRGSELTAAGLSSGDVINSLAFNYQSVSAQATNLTIRIKSTTSQAFPNNTFEGGGTLVYSGTYTPATGWNVFTFNTPYIYDGNGIIVSYCFDNTTFTGNSNVYYTDVGFNSNRFAHTDGAAGCSLNGSGLTSNRPNIQLATILPSPVLTTTDASSVTQNSATLGGNVTIDYGSAVTERGIIYSISDSTPEIGEAGVIKVTNGTGTGTFSGAFNGLTSNTTYYYRAYAINGNGTGYGAVKSFITANDIPTVTTANAINVVAMSADLGGVIIHNGSSGITEKGVLYSTTNASPRISDTSGTTKVIDTDAGTTYVETINGLNTSQIYYYRAYARNNDGIAYGAVKRFSLNNGLHFASGTSNRVIIADNPLLNFSGGFTAEAWINTDNVSGSQTIFSQYQSNNRGFSLILKGNGTFEYTANVSNNANSEEYYDTNNTAIVGNTWYHVAITYDGTTMRAYLNGVDVGTLARTGTLYNSSQPIEIGRRSGGVPFKGIIDEVRFWGRALSQQEISEGMNTQILTSSNGLIAYYKMNQGVAGGNNIGISQLTDSSPNNLNGSLQNFARTGTSSNFVVGANGTGGISELPLNKFTSTGNWSDTSKWSLGVLPSGTRNTRIENGVIVTVDQDNVFVKNLSLETGATLNIANDKELTINGVFNANGTLDVNSNNTNSGVLFIKGNATGTITYRRGGLIANKWSIVCPPVSGQAIKTFAENATNSIRTNTGVNPVRYAIGYYDDSQTAGNKWQYYNASLTGTETFNIGQGYAFSRSTNGEVLFTGSLQTETISKPVDTDKWNAVGNPFTTYFPANKNGNSSFLNDNASNLDINAVYIWDHTQSKYVAYTDLVSSDERSLTPGQGFFIKTNVTGNKIKFIEEKRSIKPSSGITTFSKGGNKTPYLKLHVENGKNKVTTDIIFDENATNGFDKKLDIENFNSSSFDLFSRLVVGGSEINYTIQSITKEGIIQSEIPIGIKAKSNTQLTFTLDTYNFNNTINVYLEDRLTKKLIKLNKETAKYIVNIPEAVNDIGRFYLHTSSKVLDVIDTPSTLSNVKLFMKDKDILHIANVPEGKTAVSVFSILGKRVLNISFNIRTYKEVNLSSLNQGIYIVQLKTTKGTISKKISVQ